MTDADPHSLLEQENFRPTPFALSLSKGLTKHCPGFDRLSPNGY